MEKWITETRECKDCKNFIPGVPLTHIMHSCSKLNMFVAASMRASYKESKGTCFEEANTGKDSNEKYR